MIADVEWSRFRAAYEARRARPIVAGLQDTPGRLRAEVSGALSPAQPTAGARPAASRAPWVARLSEVSESERLPVLTLLLRAEAADTLGFETPDKVPLDRKFSSLGMDSLMMADFVSRLRKHVGIPCSPYVFDFPEVRALGPKLLEAITPLLDPKVPAPTVSTSEPESTSRRNGVSDYRPSDDAEVQAFQTVAFPDRHPDLILPRWRWMFVESARRLATEPRAWLWWDEGKLVAHMGAIPVRLKVGHAEQDASWLVDTMVLAAHRPQAIGSRLMVEAHEDLPFALSLGQSPEMRDIQFKLGWKQVAPVQVAQLLIRPENVLKRRLGTPGAWAAGIGLRASAALREALRDRLRLETAEIDRFNCRHDRLWSEMSQSVGCAVVRDASFLNWKYVAQPGQQFVRLEFRDQAAVRGVAVLMLREPDAAYGYRRAFLVDILAPLADEGLLREIIDRTADAAAERGADSLTCMHLSPHVSRALKAAGFRFRQPKRVLLVDVERLAPAEAALLLQPENWHLTQGDSDIDRPGVA